MQLDSNNNFVHEDQGQIQEGGGRGGGGLRIPPFGDRLSCAISPGGLQHQGQIHAGILKGGGGGGGGPTAIFLKKGW